jgi:hypothetical protein
MLFIDLKKHYEFSEEGGARIVKYKIQNVIQHLILMLNPYTDKVI